MAANQSVIDELVVKLTLDANDYKKNEQIVINLINKTEVTLKDADKKRDERARKEKKQTQDSLKRLKDLAAGIKKLALTTATLLGVGSIGGVVGLLTAFAGMETGLRRAAVSTGLSNRELQAWGSTARRLGADAQAGAAAIAELGREQKLALRTGSAPTLQAFQRMGVNAGLNTPIIDILSQAQKAYRSANPGQQQQIESDLTAQGVAPDLILAIKSETDIREAFNKSFAESTEENKQTMSVLNDAISAASNAMTAFANTVATAARPYIAQLGQWASQAATDLGQFVVKVLDAGGGLDGFMKVLNDESPGLAANLKTVASALVGLGQTALVIVYGFRQLGDAVSALSDWVFKHLGGTAQKNVSAVVDWVKQAWNDAVQSALGNNPEGGGVKLSPGAAARVAGGELGGAVPAAPVRGAAANPTTQELAAYFVSRGMSPDVALGLAVNAEGESWKGSGRAKASAVNPISGASGIFQWLGPRLENFKASHGGLRPDQTPWRTQADFVLQDFTEQTRLRGALAGVSGTYGITQALNDKFEANNLPLEGIRRATQAQQLASAYGGTTGAGVGQQINIQSMTVQANTPQEFVGGITRQSGVQSYNSAVR